MKAIPVSLKSICESIKYTDTDDLPSIIAEAFNEYCTRKGHEVSAVVSAIESRCDDFENVKKLRKAMQLD